MRLLDKVAEAVYTEQVAAVFRLMPIALIVNLDNAVLTASGLTPVAFVLAASVPMAARFAVECSATGHVLGLMTIAFADTL